MGAIGMHMTKMLSNGNHEIVVIDKKELNKENDNEPIGIILCTEKDHVQVEFALSGIGKKMFVSKYKLYLPTKEELEREVKRLL